MKKILSLFTLIFTACSNPQYKVPQKSLHEFTVKDIDGKDINLNTLKGKTVLVVNVASKCGLTKQYTDLQKLYDNYKDKDFVIIGFPANDFMGQEPGTNEDIKKFCSLKYDVNFPMMSKISVKGDDMAPLYKFLVSDPTHGGKIKWNFDKFLVDQNGKIINRFSPRTKPLDAKITKAIDASL
ncbi:glutathione peroxidase [Lentisphaera profundi]|uniref:Glutathione peroxidase n=1 Tax=Lentisphaera profundi TaxID=1658616 RepID=A0ABY7VQP3_9BACT|nr:glutathione peroxidase [Lentisphaera profundi]WDE95639.1 glutathione peroxidase [Lentisphaera profundi]